MKDFTVFEFDNYREFLKKTYEYRKANDPRFSFRYFSKTAGFKSSSMLKYVMDGKRNLSLEASRKFAEALNLNKKESDFFVLLVTFNQSENLEEKQNVAHQLISFAGYHKCHPLSDSQLKYYSLWYFAAVKEMVGLPAFKEDPVWISRSINDAITPSEARRALEELQNLKLITRDGEGRLVPSDTSSFEPNEIVKVFAFRHHKEMLMRATDTIKNVSEEKHSISSMTIKLPEAAMERARQVIQRFHNEMIQLQGQSGAPDTIFQLNLALFPLTRVLGADGTSQAVTGKTSESGDGGDADADADATRPDWSPK